MSTVQHIAFNCINRAGQEAFYAKHFGFRRCRVFNAGRPDEFVMLRLGGTCIELFSAGAKAPARGGEQGVGFRHLAFEVPDLDAAVASLRADGFRTDEIIDCSAILEGLRVCFFDDPEGNRLELMEGFKDDPGA